MEAQLQQDTTSHSEHEQSSVIPGTNLPIQSDVVNLENPVDTREDRYNNPNVRNGDEGITRKSGPEKMEIDFERSSVEARGPGFENLPQIKPDATFIEEAKVSEPMISPLMDLEEDPAKISPSNYQTKVTDPTGHGGKEVEVVTLLERLDNFHIHTKSQSHDQIAPQSTPTVDQFTPESNPVNPCDTVAGKISSATSAIAVSAKDMVASKLGYGDVSAMPSVERGGGDAVAGRGSGGGVSVKEYLAEKLRPGEEDKALSEAITGRFYKRMAPGRVTEASGGEGSGGGGVVDRLKGAVGSWIGKSSSTGD